MRKVLVTLVTSLAVILSASPAWAVEESGTLYCSEIFEVETARASAYGNLRLKGPGDSSYVYYDLGGSWQTRYNSGAGGYWRAYISGYGGLDNQGTYAYCA